PHPQGIPSVKRQARDVVVVAVLIASHDATMLRPPCIELVRRELRRDVRALYAIVMNGHTTRDILRRDIDDSGCAVDLIIGRGSTTVNPHPATRGRAPALGDSPRKRIGKSSQRFVKRSSLPSVNDVFRTVRIGGYPSCRV